MVLDKKAVVQFWIVNSFVVKREGVSIMGGDFLVVDHPLVHLYYYFSAFPIRIAVEFAISYRVLRRSLYDEITFIITVAVGIPSHFLLFAIDKKNRYLGGI